MTEPIGTMKNVHYDDEGKLAKGSVCEVRCEKCGKLLFKTISIDTPYAGQLKDVKPEKLVDGAIECKCTRCGQIMYYTPTI